MYENTAEINEYQPESDRLRADTLVTTPIFHRFEQIEEETLQIYHCSAIFKRPFTGKKPIPPIRTEITEFSRKSQTRLYFHLLNTAHLYKSQFVGTYHNANPINGRELCSNIDRFNKVLYRLGIDHTHVKEWQTEGRPHIHWYLTAEYSETLWKKLGKAWHKIAGKFTSEPELHRWWHCDRISTKYGKKYRSLISWEMNPGYALKYLSKHAQKCIPERFKGFGQFWGYSRKIKPQILQEITSDAIHEKYFIDENLNIDTGELSEGRQPLKQIARILGKYQERKNKESINRAKKKGKKLKIPSPRKLYRTFTVHQGAKIINQTFNYWSKEDERF